MAEANEPHRDPLLDQIWAQHVDLHKRVRALAESLESEAALSEVITALERLRDKLPEHFALEERGGYFSLVLRAAPDLRPRADVLEKHHAAFLASTTEILERLRELPEGPDAWAFAHSRISELIASLEAHEAAENDLVRDALDRAEA